MKSFRNSYKDPIYKISKKLSEAKYIVTGGELPPGGKVVHFNSLLKYVQKNLGQEQDQVQIQDPTVGLRRSNRAQKAPEWLGNPVMAPSDDVL
jgi:hypothetical protein